MLHLQRKTGDIIKFTQFEERNLLSETREDKESGDKSDDNLIITPLLSEEATNTMDDADESDAETRSTFDVRRYSRQKSISSKR